MAIDFFKIGQAAAPSSVDISKAVKEGLAEGLKPIQEYEKSRKQRIEALGRILQQTPNLDQLPKITAQYKQPIMDWAMGKKKEFSDAAAVLVQASPESQEYRDAIQKINSVNSAFQNLDNNLKNIQAERKEYLEDLRSGNISDAFQNSDIEQAYGANGGITSINEDGTVFMTGNEGKSFNWSERQEHYLVQGDTQKAMVDLANKATARGLQGIQYDKNQYKEELKAILTNPKIGSLQSLRSLVYDNIDGTDLNLKTISEIKNLVDDPNAFQNLPQIREQIAETLSTALADINKSNYVDKNSVAGGRGGGAGTKSDKQLAQEYYNAFIEDPISTFAFHTGYEPDFDKNTGIIKATDADGKQFIANLKTVVGRKQFFRLLLDKSGYNKGTRNAIVFDFDNIVAQNSQEDLSKLFEGASTQEQPNESGPQQIAPGEYTGLNIGDLSTDEINSADARKLIKNELEKYEGNTSQRNISETLKLINKDFTLTQKDITMVIFDRIGRDYTNKKNIEKFKNQGNLNNLLNEIQDANDNSLGNLALKEKNAKEVLEFISKQDNNNKTNILELSKKDFLIYEYVQAGGNIEDIVNNNNDIDITFKQ